jgi:hypothetical protein
MNQEQFKTTLREFYDECLAISAKKNADYADADNPFKNFEQVKLLGISVEKGIMVRILDKTTRVGNLLDREAKVEDEKIHDTLIDISNYCAILDARLKYNQILIMADKIKKGDIRFTGNTDSLLDARLGENNYLKTNEKENPF